MGDSLSRLAKNLSEPLHLHRSRRTLARLHAQETGIEEWIDQALLFKGSRRIKTLQLRTEIRALCNLVAAIEPQRIAEIGTARGGTLLLWCQMATERVVSCDLRVRRFVRRLAPSFPPPGGCRVEVVEGDTHSPQVRERLWRDIGRFGLDFLFIDGDHTAAGVEQDYRDYCGLVRPGGLIALHDIVEKQTLTTNQVGLFWRKLLCQADVAELVEDPGQSGYGIGVVQVPAEGASFPS
ncbi:MAG: class I SAM-dependent methyltransferase, partial [Candidatus Eisenbacteria bacterium]|nr:class I SAM-dependent methyltransferase [Candidatus Eisenbacteria bacterium]